jgi:ADP-ribosylglycohydrolase
MKASIPKERAAGAIMGTLIGDALLTGALAGAQVGLRGIPQRFIAGLANSEGLLEMADRVARAGKAE